MLSRVKDQGQDKDAKSSCCLEKHGEKVQNLLLSILKNKVAYKYLWFQMLIFSVTPFYRISMRISIKLKSFLL